MSGNQNNSESLKSKMASFRVNQTKEINLHIKTVTQSRTQLKKKKKKEKRKKERKTKDD